MQDLIDELGRLPGIGPKSAQRIAFHILTTESFDVTHLAEVLLKGKADAVLAASIFHFGEYTVGDVKKYLASRGIDVRPAQHVVEGKVESA